MPSVSPTAAGFLLSRSPVHFCLVNQQRTQRKTVIQNFDTQSVTARHTGNLTESARQKASQIMSATHALVPLDPEAAASRKLTETERAAYRAMEVAARKLATQTGDSDWQAAACWFRSIAYSPMTKDLAPAESEHRAGWQTK
jgi:hypothetical protein